MKKFFSIVILIVMMLGVFTVCEAELPDISCLSYAELMELKSKINETIDETMILIPFEPNGYEIGKDIPEGLYMFSVEEVFDGGDSLRVNIYSDEMEEFFKVVPITEKFMYKFEKGMRLKIRDGAVRLDLV